MKSKPLWFLLFPIVVIFCIVFLSRQTPTEPEVTLETFNVEDYYYQQRIDGGSDDMVVNAITGKDDAIQEAFKLFRQKYNIQPPEYALSIVAYDSVNDVWWVCVQPAPVEPGGIVFGGAKCVLIRSDGQVLAIWDDK